MQFQPIVLRFLTPPRLISPRLHFTANPLDQCCGSSLASPNDRAVNNKHRVSFADIALIDEDDDDDENNDDDEDRRRRRRQAAVQKLETRSEFTSGESWRNAGGGGAWRNMEGWG